MGSEGQRHASLGIERSKGSIGIAVIAALLQEGEDVVETEARLIAKGGRKWKELHEAIVEELDVAIVGYLDQCLIHIIERRFDQGGLTGDLSSGGEQTTAVCLETRSQHHQSEDGDPRHAAFDPGLPAPGHERFIDRDRGRHDERVGVDMLVGQYALDTVERRSGDDDVRPFGEDRSRLERDRRLPRPRQLRIADQQMAIVAEERDRSHRPDLYRPVEAREVVGCQTRADDAGERAIGMIPTLRRRDDERTVVSTVPYGLEMEAARIMVAVPGELRLYLAASRLVWR